MLTADTYLQSRYRIIRQLGQGGMGAVYEAKDERLGSSVALKEIIVESNHSINTEQLKIFQRAFEREAKLLASLHHEAFPRVTDYFFELNRQFLIMELVSGDDLGVLLNKTKKPFTLEKVLKWTEQLLDALDYLHTQNPPTFHRDIKPQNLKVTNRGKIKLLDFGIAKSVDNSASTITNLTFVGATLNYSPVEQILPAIAPTFREFIALKHREKVENILQQTTDARCDIYSVGATIYHLLTNKIPIEATKRSLEIWEGNADPLPNPATLNSEISNEFSEWLLKALAVERENRFSTASEMQIALQKIVSDENSKAKLLQKEQVTVSQVSEKLNTELTLVDIKTEKMLVDNETVRDENLNSLAEIQLAVNTSPIKISSDSFSEQVSDTQPFEDFADTKITKKSYFDENLLKKKETESIFISNEFEETESSPKYLRLIPIVALSVLTVSGIGGLVLWNNLDNKSTPQSVVNSTVTKPTVTPTISATPTPSITPTNSLTVTPTVSTTVKPTISPKISPTQKPKPTVIPTLPPKVVSNKTSESPKLKSDDCIYNGRGC